MPNLTQDERMALEIQFQSMAAQGILTLEEAQTVIRFLLNLPPWTPEDEAQEQVWLDSIAPTADERTAMHARADARHAKVQSRS